MSKQKPGRRGRNYEFILKRGHFVHSFETMSAVGRFLNVCTVSILNAINKKRILKGGIIECIQKPPNYVKQFNLNGKEVGRFETISDAAKFLKKKKVRGNKLSSLESGISFAIHTGKKRFNYWWRREGVKIIIEEKSQINKQKKKCSYFTYDEKNDRHKKCNKEFISEGNHNHYCSECREYMDLNAENFSFKSVSRISQPDED